MKHYSASLIGQSNQVEDTTIDSRLQIGANDSIEILAPNTTSTGTDATTPVISGVGLHISTTAAEDKYLDGAGRERLLSAIPGAAVVTNLHVPISNGTTYVDSVVTQSAQGPGASGSEITINLGDNAFENTAISGDLGVAGDVTITGGLTVMGATDFQHSSISTYADTYIELNVKSDKTSAQTTGQVGGILIEDTFDAGGTNATYGGLRWNGGSTAANKWEYNNSAAADGTGGAWVAFGGGAVTSVQGGQGVRVATSGTDATNDGLTPSVASPVLSIDLTATAAGVGGLGFTTVAGNGNDTLGIAPEGITEQMLNANTGTATQVLTLANATTGAFAWVDQSTIANAGSGTVRKVGEDFAAVAATPTPTASTVTVDTTTTNSLISGSNFGSDVQVAVYEDISSGADGSELSQILPQSIVVNASRVVITFPNGRPKGRVVITG